MKFNKNLIDKARQLFHKVYVDLETPEKFIGDDKGYIGDRVRIYATGWQYEVAETFRDNESLEKFITEWEATDDLSWMD